jgi:uncharacterized protein
MVHSFGLVLLVNHACNLRCTYCYTGEKIGRPMPRDLGRRAIDRAVASLAPGGRLELGFFGGEPLLEAALLLDLLAHARQRCDEHAIDLSPTLTTNGTLADGDAWTVLADPQVDLAISHDGLPELHDRHRLTIRGQGTSGRVVDTMRRLIDAGRAFRVVMVVRPDTLDGLPDGIEYLRSLGVRQVEPSLDLWTTWTAGDVARLERAVARCAELWRQGLPLFGIGWFDEKAAHASGVRRSASARCGFGAGEIAVAPSGNLYPCERLVGADEAGNPMRLPGHVLDGGGDFLSMQPACGRDDDACNACPAAAMCNTDCRCSNYVRTGDVRRPDGLLCAWNQACLEQTARALAQLAPVDA